MFRLEHSPQITGAFTHDGTDYRIEDGIIEVDDPELAREMCEHPRLELVSVDETPTPDAEQPPFYCGVNDCSREVDSPDAVCWQHE